MEAFREAAALFCRLDLTVEEPAQFRSETRIALAPDVLVGLSRHSTCIAERTPALAAAGSDNLMIHLPVSGAFRMRQDGGEEVICQPGSVYIDPNEVAGRVAFLTRRTDVLYLSLPRVLVPDPGHILRRRLAATPDWRFAADYARTLLDAYDTLPEETRHLGMGHLRDLALAALGRPALDGGRATTAQRAARLAAPGRHRGAADRSRALACPYRAPARDLRALPAEPLRR